MPPMAAATYNMVSESATEFSIQAMATRMLQTSTTIFGPKRSTIQPSIGTSQVSMTTKMVNATWMEGRPQWNLASIGPTNSVQPYCRLAIITMQTMPMTNCSQRPDGARPAAADAAGAILSSPPFAVLSCDWRKYACGHLHNTKTE